MTHSRLWRSTAHLTSLAAAILGTAAPAHAALDIYTAPLARQAALTSLNPVTLIDFDGLAAGMPLASPYLGHCGLSLGAFNSGNPKSAKYNFTYGGANVVSLALPVLTGGGGSVAMDFATAQQGVAFWYLDSEIAGHGATVFDGANLPLGRFEMAYPDPSPSRNPNPNLIAWRFVGTIDLASDLRRVTVASAPSDMIALDSLQMAPVSESASAALALSGGAPLRAVRRATSVSRGGAQ